MLRLLLVIFADSAPDPNLFTQLGVASVVAVMLSTGLFVIWRQSLAKDVTIAELHAAQLAREKELSERIVPLLVTAVEVLSTAPTKFDQALRAAQDSTQRSELDSVLSRLEATLKGAGGH